MSAQQVSQYLTAEKTAFARLNAARARMQADQLRLAQTLVRAPDGGVISARTATIGLHSGACGIQAGKSSLLSR